MSATSFASVSSMFLHRIQRSPDTEALSFPDENEQWHNLNWQEVGEKVKAISGGLRHLNLNLEERCAILSNTRYEWILIDIGILCAGGATTTIYPSSSADETLYILSDSGSKYVFAENNEQVEKILSVKDQLPNVEKIITIDGSSSEDGFVISLKDLMLSGAEWNNENPDGFVQRIKEQNSDNLATLIYTSGTTGKPKGVELTHDCWVFQAEGMDKLGLLSSTDKQYLWLPLSHSFGKLLSVSIIRIGIPTAVDGRIEKIVENMASVQPTFIAAVPRIFEKVYNKTVSKAKANGESSLKYKIFRWAVSVGELVSIVKQKGHEPPSMLKLKYAVADKLVFSKLKQTFGGNLKFFISGSAPLSNDIATFFHAAGLLILEGYGLTESSAGSFVNVPENYKFGTVGKPIPGVEYKLLPVPGEEGEEKKKEILLGGRGIMNGYYNLPKITNEVFYVDEEENKTWLKTGDAGEVDEDGFLKITDRIKNLIKTSGGKYVAPQKIEGKIKALCPFVSQALVHGNKRNFCSMLVTLDEEQLQNWAEEAGLDFNYKSLTEHSAMRQIIQNYVDILNEPLMSYETIKKFAILPQDFTIEGGELTPSMKVKRKFVERKYVDTLDSFYKDSLQSI
jgi:long-chain acyl-CoA synthetase